MSHNERCKECKKRVRELLDKIFGRVIPNYRISMSTKSEEFREHPRYSVLNEINASLQNHRGFTEFVRASYVDVDFFLPEPGMIVEFDESQHFTEPRKIALSHYPSDLKLGFSREEWMKHCDETHAYDNDPPFRDEQRAWYDTMRDFLPEINGLLPTVRLYAKDMAWCSLDVHNETDIEKFRKYIEKGEGMDIDIRADKFPLIARVIISGSWSGEVSRCREVLEVITKKWETHPSTKFLITPGAFIRFKWPEKYPLVGDVTYPNSDAVEALRCSAEDAINDVLTPELREKLGSHVEFITIGADSRNDTYQIEFICVINLSTNERKWTGKSYPNSDQEQQLIRITDLESHYLTLNNQPVLILGCHDLHIFNNRWDSREEMLSQWRIETRSGMNNLSQKYRPTIVLQHPHTTDSCGTWRQGWSGLLEKIGSVETFASAGLYYRWGDDCRNSLDEILQATKQGDTLDFIFYFEKNSKENRQAPQTKLVESIENTLKEEKQEPQIESNLYTQLREGLDPLFGESIIDQKTKFTYRGKNNIGYPKKTELDMISLYKNKPRDAQGMRCHIYRHVLAGHLVRKDLNGIFEALPSGFVEITERRDAPHPGHVFIKGEFSNVEGIEKFVRFLRLECGCPNQDICD